MPFLLRPDRGDVPELGNVAFDALLARTLRPEEAVASLRPLAESLAALYAAPVHSAQAAEESAMAAFRSLARARGGLTAPGYAPAGRSRGPGGRGHGSAGWGRRVSLRLGIAAAAVALTAGGVLAAYSGALPAPAQQLAHTLIDAPAAPAVHGVSRPEPGHAAPPPVTGNEAYGLCRAYERADAGGHAGPNPVAFRRLAAVAGGASRVAAYCAQLVHPGNPASSHPPHSQHGQPAAHHGKPSWAATHGAKRSHS